MSESRRSVIWDVEFYPTARKEDIAELDPTPHVTADWELTDNYDPDFELFGEPNTLDPDNENNRFQRKWIATMTEEEWRAFAEWLMIELEENGDPKEAERSMGQLIDEGLIPDTFAVSLEPMDWNVSGVTPVWDASVNVSQPLEMAK